MQSAKISSEIQSLIDGQIWEILVPESNYLLLCDEKSQFVLALVAQLRELNTCDLGPD